MKPESAVMSKREPGRPKLVPDGVRKTVLLDAGTIERGELLGGGNLSLGIRKALSLGASAESDPQKV